VHRAPGNPSAGGWGALALALCACGGEPAAAPIITANDAMLLGTDGATVSLSEVVNDGGAADAEPLLVRVVTGWCGTCRWSAAHTAELMPGDLGARVDVLDVLVSGEDNAPATERDITTWQARSDGVARVLADPSFQLRELFAPRKPLPLMVILEPGSLRVLAALSNPAPHELEAALGRALAQLGGEAPPAASSTEITDARFTRDRWGMIEAMALTTPPAPDPSNAVADDPAAAAFGRVLFADRRLSPADISCESCHWPELAFQDGRETPSEGRQRLDRNAPTTLLAGFADTQLWDGRADSQWMQAVLPIESEAEFGSSRLYATHAVFDHHRAEYEALFGPLPPLDDAARFPAEGGPGDPAWEALPEADRREVTRAFVNIGKSIAAFERSQRVLPNALDAYASGQLDALDDAQKDGLAAFFEAGCVSCHYGPLLTNGAFHNLRFPSGRRDRAPDRGRIDGITQLRQSDLHRAGAYSDAAESFVLPTPFSEALGAFKTPSLRGVGYTLPYGHGGSYWGLTSAIEAHRAGGLPPDSPYTTGAIEPFLPDFDPALTPRIVTFLLGLRLDVEASTIDQVPASSP